ncbi:MAG: hypothetical protein ACR2JU_07645 [Nocardioidaceae bacterium]
MTEIVIKYPTLSLSQQILERQQTHANAIGSYLPSNASIGDSTGALLSIFDPLSQIAVCAAQDAAQVLGRLETATAGAVGDTAQDLAHTDGQVGQTFHKLLGRLGSGGAGTAYPDLGGATLPTAGESAPDDYGHVDSYFWQKNWDSAQALAGGADDARNLVHQVMGAGGPHQVTELVDASSFLVSPSNPDNFVQDLRWSAGILLGSIDWVAEKFIGFSILDRCVFHPLAGDWQGIYRASEAWKHAGDAAMGIAKNHAGLVASTGATWQGQSGTAFRGAMTSVSGACIGLSSAYAYAGGLVKTISTVCKVACIGIGAGLQFIANKLLKMAAEAATPVIGWAVGAVTAYSDIQAVVSKVRLIYTIIETIDSAIKDFIEAKTAIFGKLSILESLLEGLVRETAGAAG